MSRARSESPTKSRIPSFSKGNRERGLRHKNIEPVVSARDEMQLRGYPRLHKSAPVLQVLVRKEINGSHTNPC
jgi:hypothetical protein